MEKIKEILCDMGFEEREIRIYLTLIKSGDLAALQIAKDARIDRTTTYDLLEKLMQKGIVSVYLKNGAKNFHAISPNKLLTYFKEKYSSLEMIIPELNKISNQAQDAVKCELFYGKEGLKTVCKDIIVNAKEIKWIGKFQKEYEEILGYFNNQAILKLNRFNAKEYAIVDKYAKFTKLKKGDYRYLDKKLLSPVTTMIYNDIVLFFVWKEPYFAIRIENESFRKAQEEYFDILWKTADKKE